MISAETIADTTGRPEDRSLASSRQIWYAAIFALFLLSGATSLVYEVVWLRQLVLIFGSTQFATSTVLSTFMGGLALGAFVAGRWLARSTTPPLKLYGLLEIGIGVYALAVPFLFRSLSPMYQWIWNAGASDSFIVLSLAKFVGIGFVLLPPTVLMGASLPVLARQIADDPDRIGGKVGGLYAINVFGAVAGVFIAGFVAVPTIGVAKTIGVTAAVNVLIGIGGVLLARRLPPFRPAETAPGAAAPRTNRVRIALVAFALSGFGALVLEVAWTRVLVLVLGSSVYAFALMLLAFLIGLAVGGAFFSAFLRRRPDTDPARVLVVLLAASGLLAYVSAHLFDRLPEWFAGLLVAWDSTAQSWILSQFVLGMLVMFPTTFALGGIFPAVLQIHARSLDEVAGSVGTVYAANTLGTILGAGIAGFLLIPTLGVLATVVSISVVQVVLAAAVAWMLGVFGVQSRRVLVVGAVVALAAMIAARPQWDGLRMNSGVFTLLGSSVTWDEYVGDPDDTVLTYEAEGLTAHVAVIDEPEHDNRYISVNGKIEASSQTDLETQLLSGHLPMLLHEDPKDVLVIGLASGITAASALPYDINSLRILEIEEAMIPAARLFEEHNNYLLDDPRVTLSINDARNELEFSSSTYDIIISEPSNPWMTIAANLFTEEFFGMARTRVREGGIFSQWVQTYSLSPDDVRSVIRAFQKSFPHVLLFEVNYGVDLLMMGAEHPLELDLERIEGKLTDLYVRMDLGRVGLSSSIDIISTFRLGDHEIQRIIKDAARNTDDNARVEFNAPKSLGHDTVHQNVTLLRQYGGSALDYVKPRLEDPVARDQFRMRLAQSLIEREDYDLAVRQLRQITAGPLRDQAVEVLAQLEEISSGS